MSAITLKLRVRFGKEPERSSSAKAVGDSKRISRVARTLALAYHIERLLESGELEDYAEAARIFRVTRARMTQVMNLLSLSADIQESLLSGTLQASERRLRELGGNPHWESQCY